MKEFHFNFIAIAVSALIIGAAGIILWQNTVVQDELDEKEETIISLQTQLQDNVKDELKTPNDVVNKNTNSVSDSDFPIVTYVPGGQFSSADKIELNKKLISPYFDFYNEDGVYALTMSIESPDDSPGPWGVFVTNKDGSYNSFSYGNNEAQSQNWWLPDCLGPCAFSNTFKGKYPEIVSEVQS